MSFSNQDNLFSNHKLPFLLGKKSVELIRLLQPLFDIIEVSKAINLKLLQALRKWKRLDNLSVPLGFI